MSAQGDAARRLQELHEGYVWEVNAAIGEGREDLVWALADGYLREATAALVEAGGGCQRPGCAICSRPRLVPSPRRQRRIRFGPRRSASR